ncbi:DPP9, partial [Acrasis kona]
RKLTIEEELLRERQRSRTNGISSYITHESTHQILLPSGCSLLLYNTITKELIVLPTPIDDVHAKMDAKFSPDGCLVSYISDRDIYFHDIKKGLTHRITTSPDNCTSGVAEFIMQEEFDRFTGYWWDPSCPVDQTYRVAYLEVDESKVPHINIPNGGCKMKVDQFRYPRAGEPNAKSTLCVIDFEPSTGKLQRKKYDLCTLHSWHEYVSRCGWTPDGYIYLNLLERSQQRSAIVLINPKHDSSRTILEEKSESWINVKDSNYFLRNGNLIHLNETLTGFNHLYMYVVDAKGQFALKKQITSGDWQVDFNNCKIYLDEPMSIVYFMGTKDTFLERHVYYTNYESDSNVIERITDLNYDHDQITFNGTRTRMICNRSNLSGVVECIVYEKSLLDNKWSKLHVLDCTCHYSGYMCRNFPIIVPKIFRFYNSSQDLLCGCYYLPEKYDPNKSYPALLYIYGGPAVQLVTNNYSLRSNGRLQFFASLGYVVIMIDGRGSSRRGLAFESILKNSMGQFEVIDHIEGIDFLIRNNIVNIDKSRVAAFGWSYGGYLALMCLAQFGHYFRAVVAGAPVTCWELYDSGYTERYMGMPDHNASGYKLGSVLHYVPQLPDDCEDRLLLLCGMMDENVHFAHTTALIDELIECGKGYTLAMYPSERHSIRSYAAVSHYLTKVARFLLKNVPVNK